MSINQLNSHYGLVVCYKSSKYKQAVVKLTQP
jgi:hypothetical protein